eukprot:TRINITY_DN13165_c0_g1_i1.p1 TRINITY_DN13165_c0_g1~~TRINITY_DN13165_c0_g1_i1.p1  ORF type:complete len:592 (-),score=90.91 TRINITY_DN13165_c0_g1_i1:64-1812(-)
MMDGAPQLVTPSLSSWHGEEILVRWPAKCKKRIGELLFTESRLVHLPDEVGEAGSVVIALVDVEKFEFSKRIAGAEASRPAALKLVTRGGAIFVVELICKDRRWVHQAELSTWIRTYQEEEARRSQEELTEKKLLEPQLPVVFGDRELRAQYSYLVEQTQAMSQREFLFAHANEIAARAPLPPAVAMDASSLRVGDIGKDGCAKATLSKEEVASIFQEFPALGQLHAAQVPASLSETQFWTRCLRSRYYLEATGRDVAAGHRSDPLFDALEKPAPRVEAPPQPVVSAAVDVSVDLTGEARRQRDETFAPGAKAIERKKASKLVSRLNERSAALAEAALAIVTENSSASTSTATSTASTAKEGTGGSSDLVDSVERRRTALRRHAEDFREGIEGPTVGPPSKLARLSLRGSRNDRDTQPTGGGEVDAAKSAARKNAVCSWASAVPAQAVAAPTHSSVRWMLQKATEALLKEDKVKAAMEAEAACKEQLPSDAAEIATRAQTLLQHFWSSKISDVSLRARLARELELMKAALQRWEATPQPGGVASSSTLSEFARYAVARSYLPSISTALKLHMRFQPERVAAS